MGQTKAATRQQAKLYKIYTALLTQSGTNAPVATVLENTLGGTVVWTRTEVGFYQATLMNAFTENKTHFTQMLYYEETDDPYSIAAFLFRMNANQMGLVTKNLGVTVEFGDYIPMIPIEIKVYN